MKLGLVKEQGYMEEVREAVGHHRFTGSRRDSTRHHVHAQLHLSSGLSSCVCSRIALSRFGKIIVRMDGSLTSTEL